MFGCGMPIANLFTACQELIVQSVDLARLIGRDILQMQGSQLMLGWLVIATIPNRPGSPVKWRDGICKSDVFRQKMHCFGCKRSGGAKRDNPPRQRCGNENGTC